MHQILSIAGSDSSSIAGIQADIRTANRFNTYCATAITALTAQNSSEISTIQNADPLFFSKQLDILFSDIKFDAIKIGMIPNKEIADIIYKKLKNLNIKIIFDPIIRSTSNVILANNSAVEQFTKKIIKICYLITPNISEVEKITNFKISSINDIDKAVLSLRKIGAKNILITGGHLKNNENKISNFLFDENNNKYIISNKKLVKDFRGTGCTLSTAITCNIANSIDLLKSIKIANKYVYKIANKTKQIGRGYKILG
ncbi:bifunctional hydroxymethylpyrimidine kinase/phosphomethylpyrimidine kinase [Rickettsiales bacterium]|nr:bifunctional hydroxymethylpyrimidine kinase/phosphomethylpyrimidine kinase [Rickettsiales bacterium]